MDTRQHGQPPLCCRRAPPLTRGPTREQLPHTAPRIPRHRPGGLLQRRALSAVRRLLRLHPRCAAPPSFSGNRAAPAALVGAGNETARVARARPPSTASARASTGPRCNAGVHSRHPRAAAPSQRDASTPLDNVTDQVRGRSCPRTTSSSSDSQPQRAWRCGGRPRRARRRGPPLGPRWEAAARRPRGAEARPRRAGLEAAACSVKRQT